ncbi:MAG: Crp/Fnr family transcriptional regulator [Sedimenticola sp.]
MAIKLKIARTAKELDDVFKLRHEVYVVEKKKFASNRKSDYRIVDRFDTLPNAVNIVAYHGDQAIATMRINKDSMIGLPAEEYFDFSDTRKQAEVEAKAAGVEPVIVGGSMLAIQKDWRHQRNVIFALFKIAAGVAHSMGATHGIGSIAEDTLSLYGRIGFKTLGEPCWHEGVGDTLVPIYGRFSEIYDWAFKQISSKVNSFWLENFCGQFQRILLSKGEILFSQDADADHAYAVDEGWISISRTDPEGNEMVLANLPKGALFGEMALFDGEKRSATATAITNAELLFIERSDMIEAIRRNPEHIEEILQHFAKRLRDTDNLALVQAFSPQTSRVNFVLNQLWQSANAGNTDPEVRMVRVGPEQIAKSAQVRESDVRKVLEIKKVAGQLDYGDHLIRFLEQPSMNDIRTETESPV